MNTNTIVLTGATGFLGSHILKGLVHTNTYHVVVLKRSFSNLTRIANLLQRHDIEYLNVDLEENTIKQRFSKGDISAVIHCATEYGRGRKPIANVLRANLIFPINLLDMCVEFGVDVLSILIPTSTNPLYNIHTCWIIRYQKKAFCYGCHTLPTNCVSQT